MTDHRHRNITPDIGSIPHTEDEYIVMMKTKIIIDDPNGKPGLILGPYYEHHNFNMVAHQIVVDLREKFPYLERDSGIACVGMVSLVWSESWPVVCGD
jgi:hypothetical protein